MTQHTTTIEIEDTNGDTHEIETSDTLNTGLNQRGYIRYNDEIGVYIRISYKTRNTEVLDYTVHDVGTDWQISALDEEEGDFKDIRADIEAEFDTTLDDDTIETLLMWFFEGGKVTAGERVRRYAIEQVLADADSDGILWYRTDTETEGWGDTASKHDLTLNDDPRDEGNVLFRILNEHTPTDGMPARIDLTGTPSAEQIERLKNEQTLERSHHH